MIYFVEAVGVECVKVGFVAKLSGLKKRLMGIQCGCPVPLKLRAVVNGSMSAEKALHDHLERYRSSGEWFNFDSDVQAVLDVAETFEFELTFDGMTGLRWVKDPTAMEFRDAVRDFNKPSANEKYRWNIERKPIPMYSAKDKLQNLKAIWKAEAKRKAASS
jgi:hypothetical protein